MSDRLSKSAPAKPSSKNAVKFPPQRAVFRGKNTTFPGFDFGAIKKWVALEERIVFDYRRKEERPTPAIVTESTTSFEAAPAVDLSVKPQFRPPKREKPRFPWLVVSFWCFWIAAFIFLIFYFQTNRFNGKTDLSLKSMFEFNSRRAQTLTESQRDTIRELKKENQILNQEVRAGRKKIAEYRDELLQLTLKYEEELTTLQQANSVNEELVRGLQAELRNAQAGFQENGQAAPYPFSGTSFPERVIGRQTVGFRNSGIQGKVIMVNSRYEFVVIDIGAKQGVRIGQAILFYKNGREFTSGRIERVYPALSGVAVFNSGALNQIEEGDTVAVAG